MDDKHNPGIDDIPSDVRELLYIYKVQDFQYHTISKIEKLKKLESKWPLIAEIGAFSKNKRLENR